MRILIIEDDERLCESLKFQLEKQGYSVNICSNGEDGLYVLLQDACDLVLLDRMLPLMDGLTVLSKARRAGISTPVILLTALGSLDDKVNGLEGGADDYIVKPFAFQELLARIRCIGRRPRSWETSAELCLGDIVFDCDRKILSKGSLTCTLSRREGDLMEMFLRNPGQILPRMTLLSRVWGPEAEVEDGNLDNYIHFLRRRLRAVSSTLTLKTVRGIGYSLQTPQ
ncbi:MAG: response regulator transcription factor [Eubacteriales bacterium]|nr:response regulator transcription factor [Eubacteriales bacterium]